ncbi:MAG: substrate-binding domain-containing protein, partial [Candidatus Ratteibacteria bacterium]
ANVSIGTVDRVLHNRGFVSPCTQRKVEWAIKKLNYTPNIYARQLKLSKRYKFGVFMPEVHQDAGYWGQAALGIRKAAKELEPYKIKVKIFPFNRYSENSFCKKFSQMLEENLDGFLIAPILGEKCKALVAQIPESVPYIFFDSDLPHTQRLTFIGQDPFKSGMLAGKLMHLLIGDHGDVAVIRILPEDYHINLRSEGFQSYFSENGSTHTIKVYDWHERRNLNQIYTLFNKIVIKNPNLRGIFMTNALTYLVASYLESKKLNKKIRVIGYDLVEENIAYLKNSIIDFLISQSPMTQGYQGIMLLYRKIVLNHDIEERIMMPIDIVTKENIEFYKYASVENV